MAKARVMSFLSLGEAVGLGGQKEWILDFQLVAKILEDSIGGYSFLLHRVALADGDGLVLQCL